MRHAIGCVTLAVVVAMLCGCRKAPLSPLLDGAPPIDYEWETHDFGTSTSVGETQEDVDASEVTDEASPSGDTVDDGSLFEGMADDSDEAPFDVDDDSELSRTVVDGVVVDYYACHSEGVPAAFVMLSGDVSDKEMRIVLTGTVLGDGVETSQTVERKLGDLVGAYGTVVAFDELTGVDGTLSIMVDATSTKESDERSREVFDIISGFSDPMAPSEPVADESGMPSDTQPGEIVS